MSVSDGVSAVRKATVIARVELRRFFHDGSAAFFVLVFPLILVLVLGSAFGDSSESRLGVVAPTGALADEVVDALDDDDDIQSREYASDSSLRDAVERGTVQAGVVLPDDYDERLVSGQSVEVGFLALPTGFGRELQVVVSDATSAQSGRVQAANFAVQHGVDDFDAASAEVGEAEQSLARVSTRTVDAGEAIFPESLGQFDLGASSQLLLFVFVNALAGSAVLIQNRQLGVSRRMLSTPTSVGVVLFGEALGRFVLAAFQAVYIMLAASLLFGVNLGSLLGAGVLVFVFAWVATGAAMLAGALFRTDQQAGSVGVVIGLGLAALGGSMAPLEIFSPIMRDIAHVTPHAWANDAFATLVRHNGGVGDILPELGVLAAMAAVLLSVATWLLRRSLTTA
jgi:ABC-2 type transport system permease protein